MKNFFAILMKFGLRPFDLLEVVSYSIRQTVACGYL
jgi:hypothetical protein